MKKTIFLTFDVEHDYSNIYSFNGCDVFMAPVIKLLDSKGIKATFFFSSDTLMRYKEISKNLDKNGNEIGVHSSFHNFLCLFDMNEQYEQIYIATKIHEFIIGSKPKVFRAPNFSADVSTIRILEKLNYEIDSSVLPGRIFSAKPLKFRSNFIQFNLPNFFKGLNPYIYDFRNSPTDIFYPSKDNICERGDSTILEIPVTKNLFQGKRGIPISGGSLKSYGLENELKSIEKNKTQHVVLVYHPWEFIDLKNNKPVLNDKLFSSLSKLIDICQTKYNFKTMHLSNIK